MDTKVMPVLALVVPCYNEAKILPDTAESLKAKLLRLVNDGIISDLSRIWFVDDGSEDSTWDLIDQLSRNDQIFVGIKLTRNYGHQFALYAGMMEANADVLITLDADLQDDIAAIEDMLSSFQRGNEIVYGVRSNRESDTVFKRITARTHYQLLSILGVTSVRDHADFRLMSRRAVELLSHYREANLYLRGIVPLLGLPSDIVYYKRLARMAGETKYPFRKMLALSVSGLTSFSIVPLRLISALGLSVFLVALCLGLWALWATFFDSATVPGWSSTVIPIYLLGGLQLLAIGVAGEYIGKIFLEAKKRPLYHVETRTGTSD
ncbi:MAG: glycosyltransferase family 2 protein [Halieaceae bacterium]